MAWQKSSSWDRIERRPRVQQGRQGRGPVSERQEESEHAGVEQGREGWEGARGAVTRHGAGR